LPFIRELTFFDADILAESLQVSVYKVLQSLLLSRFLGVLQSFIGEKMQASEVMFIQDDVAHLLEHLYLPKEQMYVQLLHRFQSTLIILLGVGPAFADS
jgi:hypothetical protein